MKLFSTLLVPVSFILAFSNSHGKETFGLGLDPANLESLARTYRQNPGTTVRENLGYDSVYAVGRYVKISANNVPILAAAEFDRSQIKVCGVANYGEFFKFIDGRRVDVAEVPTHPSFHRYTGATYLKTAPWYRVQTKAGELVWIPVKDEIKYGFYQMSNFYAVLPSDFQSGGEIYEIETARYVGLALGLITVLSIIVRTLIKQHQRRQNEEAAEKARIRASEEQEQARAQAGRDADIRKKAELEARQQQLLENLGRYAHDAKNLLKTVEFQIRQAETSLDAASHEFTEGAFAPFWDAVEQAANLLAKSDAQIGQIIEHSKRYAVEVMELNTSPPPFVVALNVLPDVPRTADRMRGIVRKAQKDFHFATIYEQRKTNKLLIAGFTNLGDALNQMTNRLESSLESLADSLSEIAETNRANTSELVASIDTIRESLQSESVASREHEAKEIEIGEKQSEMLDNIQRGRKPRRVFPKTFD